MFAYYTGRLEVTATRDFTRPAYGNADRGLKTLIFGWLKNSDRHRNQIL
ncbi:hypothetical protein [Nostoc sp.]